MAQALGIWRDLSEPPEAGRVMAWIIACKRSGWPGKKPPDAVEVIVMRMWETMPNGDGAAAAAASGNDGKPKRSTKAEVDFVIRSLDEGIKTLRGIQGKPYRPLSLTVEARRQEARKLLKSMNGTAWIVARNVPLMAHNRGENDRGTEYLDLKPHVRKSPEAFLDLCPSEDFAKFEAALRRAVKGAGRPKAAASPWKDLNPRQRAGAQPEDEQERLDAALSNFEGPFDATL